MTVYDEIKAEREYQDQKWGHESDDKNNTPWHWCAYIAKYASKWMDGSFHPDIAVFRECMVKVAAIAVAAVESIDRRWEKGE